MAIVLRMNKTCMAEAVRNSTLECAPRFQYSFHFSHCSISIWQVFQNLIHQDFICAIVWPRPREFPQIHLNITADNIYVDVTLTKIFSTTQIEFQMIAHVLFVFFEFVSDSSLFQERFKI